MVSDLILTTSLAPWRRDDPGDDLVGLGGVAGPVDLAAGARDRLFQLKRYVSRWRSVRSLIARPASRRASQSGISSTASARLARMVWVALPMLCRSCVSASDSRAASWNGKAGRVGSGSDVARHQLGAGVGAGSCVAVSSAVTLLPRSSSRSRRGSRRDGSG